jgi:multiple sugar transport system ATP-binding protein
VSHVEHLGSETNVYIRSEVHGLLTVRIFGEEDFAVDSTVHLTPAGPRTFHFNAEGRRLRD